MFVFRKKMAFFGLSGPTYKVHQVPEHFHEHFIISGYRHPKSSVKQCVLSLFDATNETLNFWTHFLPSVYFLWVMQGVSETLDFRHDEYTWPLLCYMFGCVIFPLASATAHTFNTMSDYARHICFFLDYGALSLFSCGVAIAYRAYTFPVELVDTWFGDYYVIIAVVNSLICTLTSCQTRFMKLSFLRQVLRLSAFALPYIYDTIPVVYRLIFCTPEECQLASQFEHARQFLFIILAAFLYATHLPERLNPGCFDIVGHSHQLFHVATILGTLDQMQATLHDMKARRGVLPPAPRLPLLGNSVGILTAVMILNSIIILLYSARLSSWFRAKKIS